MIAASPVRPVAVTGPAAVRTQSVGSAVPPVEPLSTTFTSVSVGAIALLVMVQVAWSPSARVTDVAVDASAPVQTHAEAS